MKLLLLILAVPAAFASQGNPIQKVIELIEELKGKIVSDGKAEELVYNRMACWCETTTKNKAEEIKTCQDTLKSLSDDMNANKGNIATQASDIHDLMTDISTNEAKQYLETTKRERQNADFSQNKAELTNAIVALEKATQMLAGVDHLALIQGKFDSQELMVIRAVKPAVVKAMAKLPANAQSKIPFHKLSALERLGQKFSGKYTPFEPTITQILKDLLESFKATSETETTNEASLQTSYEEIMSSKSNELGTKKQLLADKEEAKAKENKDLSANNAEWQKTADQLVAANKVFGSAKAACTKLAEQWDERKKLREEELKGVKDALKTLTSDENRALIGKAAADGPGKLDFFQVDSESTMPKPARQAYLALRKAATKTHSFKVAAVAARLMENVQQKGIADNAEWKDDILKKIDEILTELGTDQETDTETYDNCKAEEHRLTLEIDERSHEIKRYGWKISSLEQKVEDLQSKIAEAADQVESILEMQARLKSERDAENTEYNNEKTDDEGAIDVLKSAIADLNKFYDKQGIKLGKLNEADKPVPSSFVQDSTADDDSADDIFLQTSSKRSFMQRKKPVFKKSDDDVIGEVDNFKFADAGSRGQQSKGIIGLLTNIKEDLESDIAKATNMENDSNADYNKIKKETDDEISDLRDKMDDMKDDKSDKEGDIEDNESWKSSEEDSLDSAEKEMKTIMDAGDEGKDISLPCEFLMSQYHARRMRREAETEGLKEAVAFLEGMQ